ncbi:MBL fold metallo-hydrolase [Dyadobacter chenwenxiniae]|uniref:MBL fold metallo-hydrolase n=1 Tax=Dyadobacter chenwenxiniae TaxID=2906456 RepID=A0A9X1TDC5_9BACT|nr:MBL fold metallo-hydrolase [Dyadobacter chenwenxiniae]MCF0060160.1 MBL fold metallo-hydrolase [Dyadobacter chenwenxiniae]UON85897.1 MBL fold metallo-hydrolase [Dyadobacter chenwenxiniae]
MEQITKQENNAFFKVAEGVWGLTDIFVNVYIVQNKGDNSWVLIDAGLKTAYPKIKKMVTRLFGENARPKAIVLTHGHFDHVGSLKKLAEEWDVPVYAHHLEMAYLTGKSGYPPPDSSVGGGMMAYMADLYSAAPIDLSGRVEEFPGITPDIPFMPEWKYIHTPGHSPGHVSFWREKDKVLIAGDAVVTTKQESAMAVLLQTKIVSGPPKYFTCNWLKAEDSVDQLASLLPNVLASGHGKPMYGKDMQQQLLELAYYFEDKAVPETGRYVMSPAITDSEGIVSVPKETAEPYRVLLTVGAVAGLTALGWALYSKYRMQKSY